MKHHEDSIPNMIAHYQKDKEIMALFLVGSVATGTERPDSDLDGVAIISEEYFQQKKEAGGTLEVCHGKCTYQGGYFDIHFHTLQQLKQIAESGSEPMRNLFTNAKMLFCHPSYEQEILPLVSSIPIFPKSELAAKKLRYYCTFKQFYLYFWRTCKPQGFHRHHVANGMVFCLYRLILLENKLLFPSMRKLEESVINYALNKPNNIVEKCNKFLQTLSDDDALELIESYESWTEYDYPKNHHIINNNFADPYEWQ